MFNHTSLVTDVKACMVLWPAECCLAWRLNNALHSNAWISRTYTASCRAIMRIQYHMSKARNETMAGAHRRS